MSNIEISDVIVYHTTNYSIFNIAEEGLNRIVTANKISALMTEIQRINLLPHNPIIINSDYVIIDGQTRFYAAQKLNLPIYFTINTNLTIQDASNINYVQKPWNIMDYINHYAALKNEHYMFILDIYNKTDISITTLANIFMRGSAYERGFSPHIIRTGLFKTIHKEMGLKLIEYAKDYSKFNQFSYWKSRKFLTALSTVITNKLYDHQKMLLKLQQVPYLMENKVSTEAFISTIEQIYNHKSSSKVHFK
jgi:hypothetical protein